MPVYEYEHEKETECILGKIFEVSQPMSDDPLTKCPECGGSVKKIISRVSVKAVKSNSELRDLGFTKLVKRENGVYENVTARDGESRIMHQDKPETYPNFKKTIGD